MPLTTGPTVQNADIPLALSCTRICQPFIQFVSQLHLLWQFTSQQLTKQISKWRTSESVADRKWDENGWLFSLMRNTVILRIRAHDFLQNSLLPTEFDKCLGHAGMPWDASEFSLISAGLKILRDSFSCFEDHFESV